MSSEATQSAGFYEFLAWLETNKKQVIVGAVVVVALALIIAFFLWQSRQREVEANAALLQLEMASRGGAGSTPPSAEAYLKVASRYSSTHAGERAALQAAGVFFEENKYSQALDQFKKFQADYSSSSMVPIAAFGVAASLDALNRQDEAIKAYEDVVTRYASDPEAVQAKLALGRLYQVKNKPELALKALDSVLGANSRSFLASDAAQQKELLLAKYPTLATNKVSTPTTTPASGASLKGGPTNPPAAAKTNPVINTATNATRLLSSNAPARTSTNLPELNVLPAPAKSATNGAAGVGTNAPASSGQK